MQRLRPSGYRVQFHEGGMWRNVTHPTPNKRVAFQLADKLGSGYRVINAYTNQPATRPEETS